MAEPVVLEIKMSGDKPSESAPFVGPPTPAATAAAQKTRAQEQEKWATRDAYKELYGVDPEDATSRAAAEKRDEASAEKKKRGEEKQSRWKAFGKTALSAGLAAYGGGGLDATSLAATSLNPFAAGVVKAGQAIGNKIAPYSGPMSGALARADANRENAFIRTADKLGPSLGSIIDSGSRLETTVIDGLTTLLKPVIDIAAPVLEILTKMLAGFEPVLKLLSIALKPLDLLAQLLTVVAEKFSLWMDKVGTVLDDILRIFGIQEDRAKRDGGLAAAFGAAAGGEQVAPGTVMMENRRGEMQAFDLRSLVVE